MRAEGSCAGSAPPLHGSGPLPLLGRNGLFAAAAAAALNHTTAVDASSAQLSYKWIDYDYHCAVSALYDST